MVPQSLVKRSVTLAVVGPAIPASTSLLLVKDKGRGNYMTKINENNEDGDDADSEHR